MATTTVPTREQVPQPDRWNAESVFATPQVWDEAFRTVQKALEEAEAFKGTLVQGPERLRAWLEFKESLNEQFGKLRVYATMEYSCNTHDAAATARYDRVRGLSAQLSAKTAFAEPEIVALGRDTLRRWQEDEPALAVYGHYFDKLLRQAAHLRSAEVEELLGALSSPFSSATSTHGVLANTDVSFTPAVDRGGDTYEITQGNVRKLLASPDRTLRESAYKNYADAHLSFKNTMANVISAGMKQNVFMARARRYDSALEAALAPENIPTRVFHTLIETFKANLPTWHRYWRVRREMLGVDTLHPYDTFAPLAENAPEIPYEQAVAWIAESLRPLGDAYVTALRRGALEDRWVDKYPNKGKRMGAFSAGVKGAHPFIMMSYTDDAFGMSTLAHELGHSMHSHFSWQNQPTVYRYSLFVAEVASNFNQAMLRAHLFEQHPDPSFQIAIIEEAMANFYRYFFVMPTLARFELELH